MLFAAGAQTVLSFDVTVDDGSQGKFIVNTAILDDNGKETPMPDGGVQIDEGEAAPIVNKSASVTTAKVGDIFTYTVTRKEWQQGNCRMEECRNDRYAPDWC